MNASAKLRLRKLLLDTLICASSCAHQWRAAPAQSRFGRVVSVCLHHNGPAIEFALGTTTLTNLSSNLTGNSISPKTHQGSKMTLQQVRHASIHLYDLELLAGFPSDSSNHLRLSSCTCKFIGRWEVWLFVMHIRRGSYKSIMRGV